MRRMLVIVLLVSNGLAVPAIAQGFFDESSACAAITRPGLFYVRTQPTLRVSQIWPTNGDTMVYDRGARFVLVTPATNPARTPDYEGVWHVRTQTTAEDASKANKAHVYRPPAHTRCGFMPELSVRDRMVSLQTYLDHHVSDPNNVRPRSQALSRGLHMKIKDVTDGACVATDDRREYDVSGTYGFEDTDRRHFATDFEADTSATRPSIANVVSARYHGLSSQFAYRGNPAGACVSFAAPIPTGKVPKQPGFWNSAYDDAFQAAATWKPLSTLIVLKRLEGRRVTNVMSKTIWWKSE